MIQLWWGVFFSCGCKFALFFFSYVDRCASVLGVCQRTSKRKKKKGRGNPVFFYDEGALGSTDGSDGFEAGSDGFVTFGEAGALGSNGFGDTGLGEEGLGDEGASLGDDNKGAASEKEAAAAGVEEEEEEEEVRTGEVIGGVVEEEEEERESLRT